MENLALQEEAVFMAVDGEKREYTVEDILALPEGERGELIDGELFMMASPAMVHQMVLMWMSAKVFHYIEKKDGKCKVFPAPFAVFLKNDNKNYVEPDIVVVCDRDKLDEQGCHGAPDWAVEIVSPSSKVMDYCRKLEAYRTAGIREYWIVDPERETVIVYALEHGEAPCMYHFTDLARTGIFEDFTLDFSELKEYLEG